MALYLVCGSRERHVYTLAKERLARSRLLTVQPGQRFPIASFCTVEDLDDHGLPFSGLMLLPEDDTASIGTACDALQKLNLTIAPLIVQDTWQPECLPGLLLFECREDPGADYVNSLCAKSRSIVGVHLLSFCRWRLSPPKQFQVLVVVLTGGPQALNFERVGLTRLICADLRLERGLFARLSRPQLGDNPPYVPKVDSRCFKMQFLLVRGCSSYADRIRQKFTTVFDLTKCPGVQLGPEASKYFSLLGLVDRRSPAYKSDSERRTLMDHLISYKNCRVDEMFVCQLDTNTCMSPVIYSAPPVGLHSSPYLLMVTDAWGPSKAALLDACRGQSYGCFFTANSARIAVIQFDDAGDRHSTALAVLALGVQVFAVFINDWIVHVETVPYGPLQDSQFSQSAKPHPRSLVMHGTKPQPQQPQPQQPQPQQPQPQQPKPLQNQQARCLLPTPAPTTPLMSASPAKAASREASPMSLDSNEDETAEDRELASSAGEAPEAVIQSERFRRGPRTPPGSPVDDQPPVAALPTQPAPPPSKPPPSLLMFQQLIPESDLMSNVCLEVSPLEQSVSRSEIEQLLVEQRCPSEEDWQYVLEELDNGSQRLLLFAEDPRSDLCRCFNSMQARRSSDNRRPPVQVTRRSIVRSEAGRLCPLPLRLAACFRPRGLWLCDLRPGELSTVLNFIVGPHHRVGPGRQRKTVLLHFEQHRDCINSYLLVCAQLSYNVACYLCLGSE